MSQTIVLPQLYRPLFGAVSVDHGRSPFWGKPSEWDLLGTDALLITEEGAKVLLGERFRRMKYAQFGDITLRWRSSMTGDLLEAHSLNCQYFVYAYVDEEKGVLGAWWVLYPNKFLEGIRSGALSGKEETNPGKGGSIFMAFKPQDLEREGCIYRHNNYRLDGLGEKSEVLDRKSEQMRLGGLG